MAWIKLETHTFDKVEIYAIAEQLGLDADSVIGKCCRVWSWFDANTTDGVTKSVTKALLDRQCGVIGFCDAMIVAGWMADDGIDLMLPYYDRHNTATAKSRALGSKRQSKFKSNAQGNASGNDTGNGEALPKSSRREEKRREEEIREDKDKKTAPEGDFFIGIDSQIVSDFKALRAKHRAPITKTAISGIQREADIAGISLEDALKMCCERNWRGFKAEWAKNSEKKSSDGQFVNGLGKAGQKTAQAAQEWLEKRNASR